MFKIGDFSTFSRVSVKMLRHYDEIGLLKPALVDPATGYRYYSADQLPRLNRIIALKDLGFALGQIARLLDDDLPADQIRGMLKLRRAEIEQRLEEDQARLSQVEARLQLIEYEGGAPGYDVVLRRVPAQMVASIRRVLPTLGDHTAALFEHLETVAARFKARAPQPPLGIYHDAEYREQEVDFEAAIPVNGPLPSGDARVYELPGAQTMACVVHRGSYTSMIDQALGSLLRWIDANGYQVAGPIREVYLRFGADGDQYSLPPAYLTTREDEFITELQIPVERP